MTTIPDPIRSRGRRGYVAVPNWRWEDPGLDPYEFRIAGWLASHTDSYRGNVSRNAIARATGISAGKVTAVLATLEEQGIITVEAAAETRASDGRIVSLSGHLQIVFDFDTWEQDPGHVVTDVGHVVTDVGHVVTEPRSCGDRIEEQEEDQGEDQGEEHAALVSLDDSFTRFWSSYHRHRGGKPSAQKEWKAALKKATVEEITEGLRVWRDFWEADSTEDRFIPHASKWLKDERWDASPPQPSVRSRKMSQQEQVFARAFARAQQADGGPRQIGASS